MKTIKEIISKPSEALQAMVDGLKTQSKRKDFKIRMHTFGETNGDICFGCAATCTVQQLTGINLTDTNIYLFQHSKVLNIEKRDIEKFEIAIDGTRKGYLRKLFGYFGIEIPEKYYKRQNFYLGTITWKEELPIVNKLIEELKEQGF